MNKVLLKLSLVWFVLILQLNGFGQSVIINEFMSSNNSGIQDFEGNYADWVELYNTSDEVIDLLNYALSDDTNNYKKWVFPNVNLLPKSYLIIFASARDTVFGSELHSNFKIKQSGESLILTDKLGAVLSLVEPIFVPTDKSLACITDGNENRTIADNPTPNSSNNNFVGVYCSHPSGFYKDSFDLSLVGSNMNQKIYYTLNGNQPTVNDILYSNPITIKNNQQRPFKYSTIPTTPLSGEDQLYDFIWKKPKSVYQSHTVRFGIFENDVLQGRVYTRNFFVDPQIEDRYQFPVITIATDSLNLFDHDTGIYIPGRRFREKGFNWWPEGNYHNRGVEWERRMHISYFEKNGALAFETDAGMRMRGFGSASNPQKSFTVYFRKEYGRSKIEYPVFENSKNEKFKRLIFRNGGNDFIYSHFKDAMLQNLIKTMDLDLQDFRPSVVFINGEYWGIHNIREKYDKYYFKYKYGIKENDINILGICGGIEEGTNSEYVELINYIKANDVSESESYDFVNQKMDINNFIDFQIAEIYFANYDWPCNNFKIWKDNNPNSKWRFLIYDLDYSFGYNEFSSYTSSSMEHASSNDNSWPHCQCSNLIFRKLLKNEEFKNQFLDRFAFCLINVFNSDTVNAKIDEFEAVFSLEIKEHIARWNYPSSVDAWKKEIDIQREFANERPCLMSENIISYFDLTSYEYDCLTKNSKAKEALILFPNPNNGNFALFNNSPQTINNGRLTLVDTYGRIIFSEKDISINIQERYSFHFNNLMDGMYILNFESQNITEKKKVIISRGLVQM